MPRVCTLLQRGLGREQGMSQTEERERPVPSWARMAPSLAPTSCPLQRKPEGLALSPEAPGKVFSTPIRQFQGRLAGWLCRPVGKQLPASWSQQWKPRSAHCAADRLSSSSGRACCRADLAEEERQFAKYHGTPVAGAFPPHRPQAWPHSFLAVPEQRSSRHRS